ncbi:serine/threonine-protein kinase [Nocardia sp. IBHARD005]|uniref:serine/threonine-protein kinase n=1 Tax=Nocardia sp. IBHARD005 TaxID=3457765 RepID=UPI004057F499
MALRPGAIVGGYRVINVLGSGGMGTVYLAQNPILPRTDALKVLSADLSTDAEFRARFEREANLAAGLDHPNIVAVYNRGEEDGQLWIAMQYIDGVDASDEAKKGPSVMTPVRALRIVSEVGKGLDHAHRRGLLHRDVKPANFLLAKPEDPGEEERVLLTDFGVAKSAEDSQDLTATGSFMATVAYAPPEQLVANRLDHRADIYSLGCAFFKLLTGQNPYPSTVPAVVMMGHLHEPPPRVTAVRPDLPPALDRVIAKAMAKEPADRYNTCREFIREAEAALLGTPNQAPGPHSTDPRYPTQGAFQTGGSYTTARTDVHGNYSAPQGFTSRVGAPDQHLVDTLRRTDGGARSKRRRFLLPAIIAVVVAVAVGSATYFLTRPSADATATDQSMLADVRKQHPQFDNKTVAAVNFTGSAMAVYLGGSPQADFLQDIGFRYTSKFKAAGSETAPRSVSLNSSSSDLDAEIVIVLRTDNQAGNGGLRGLPSGLMYGSAKLVIVDDLNAIQPFQVWTEQSPQRLVEKLVPTIAKTVT